jgi:hypothetical protein
MNDIAAHMTWRCVLFALCGVALCLIPAALRADTKTTTDSSSPSEHFGMTSQDTYVEQPDPQHVGKLLWQMWVKEMEAVSPEKTVQATLHGVSGVLFDKGQKSATFTAPLATGDSGAEVVVAYHDATHQVTLTSLIKIGTTIRADKVKWSALTNKGVATGHVVFHDGKSGMIVRTPRLDFDTKMETVQSSEGYSGTLP